MAPLTPPPRRILVVRPDRIGDFVLTQPMVAALRQAWPAARIEALVSARVAPLAPLVPELDAAHGEPDGFLALRALFSGRDFDLALFPYGSFHHCLAASLARIPRRVGNGLRAYSLLLTDRVAIHRSDPPLHEVDYCLALLAPLGIPAAPGAVPRLVVPAPLREAAGARLGALGIAPGGFVLVHPGGLGSAGRPSPATFARYASALAGEGRFAGLPLLVGAGPGEEAGAQATAAASGGRVLPPSPDPAEYAALLSLAALVVAGSTGPLHLAAAVGAPVLGFYPLKASQTIPRWGPRGPRARALSPDPGTCPACREARCDSSTCFERIPDAAVRQAAAQAAG